MFPQTLLGNDLLVQMLRDLKSAALPLEVSHTELRCNIWQKVEAFYPVHPGIPLSLLLLLLSSQMS